VARPRHGIRGSFIVLAETGSNPSDSSLLPAVTPKRKAWNKGRIIGQKRPLLPKQVWAIRARLELAGNLRDLALFNVAIDSKLRGCDLVKLSVGDLVKDDRVRDRVSMIQSKTRRPVQFELTENTRETVLAWVKSPQMFACRFNCAHPDHFMHVFDGGGDWTGRIGGLRTNASRQSHTELDNSETLDDGNPEEQGRLHRDIRARLPNLGVVGGCCGTDDRHVREILRAVVG
jgi:hypothetical protein